MSDDQSDKEKSDISHGLSGRDNDCNDDGDSSDDDSNECSKNEIPASISHRLSGVDNDCNDNDDSLTDDDDDSKECSDNEPASNSHRVSNKDNDSNDDDDSFTDDDDDSKRYLNHEAIDDDDDYDMQKPHCLQTLMEMCTFLRQIEIISVGFHSVLRKGWLTNRPPPERLVWVFFKYSVVLNRDKNI